MVADWVVNPQLPYGFTVRVDPNLHGREVVWIRGKQALERVQLDEILGTQVGSLEHKSGKLVAFFSPNYSASPWPKIE